MKRLGIFFFFEKNGYVDDFILYYLRDLNKNLSELVVVCNGTLSEQGRAAFSEFTEFRKRQYSLWRQARQENSEGMIIRTADPICV